MAGVKGKSGGPRPNSGGSRPGAGRKPATPAPGKEIDPLLFLRRVWTGEITATAQQVRAAIAVLPFIHAKRAEGKKDMRNRDAREGVSRFQQSTPPPKLVADHGRKVDK